MLCGEIGWDCCAIVTKRSAIQFVQRLTRQQKRVVWGISLDQIRSCQKKTDLQLHIVVLIVFTARVKHKLAAVSKASHTLKDTVTACWVSQGSAAWQQLSASSQVEPQPPSFSSSFMSHVALERADPAHLMWHVAAALISVLS